MRFAICQRLKRGCNHTAFQFAADTIAVSLRPIVGIQFADDLPGNLIDGKVTGDITGNRYIPLKIIMIDGHRRSNKVKSSQIFEWNLGTAE